MYCGICSGYLALTNDIPKKRGKISHCSGCRARDKQCAYLKGHCTLLAQNKVTYCFECDEFPCLRLQNISRRYETRYGMSFIENLKIMESRGEKALFASIKKRYSCGKCGKLKSIHNGKCFQCDNVTSWKD